MIRPTIFVIRIFLLRKFYCCFTLFSKIKTCGCYLKSNQVITICFHSSFHFKNEKYMKPRKYHFNYTLVRVLFILICIKIIESYTRHTHIFYKKYRFTNREWRAIIHDSVKWKAMFERIILRKTSHAEFNYNKIHLLLLVLICFENIFQTW